MRHNLMLMHKTLRSYSAKLIQRLNRVMETIRCTVVTSQFVAGLLSDLKSSMAGSEWVISIVKAHFEPITPSKEENPADHYISGRNSPCSHSGWLSPPLLGRCGVGSTDLSIVTGNKRMCWAWVDGSTSLVPRPSHVFQLFMWNVAWVQG